MAPLCDSLFGLGVVSGQAMLAHSSGARGLSRREKRPGHIGS